MTYYQYALNCGINMTGKDAVDVKESSGKLIMIDVIDPVTLEPILHAGTTMDDQLIDVALSYGVDYVIVYKHHHNVR